MKFGFISFQVPGHLNPMTALARHLQMRNHDVVFLYSSGAAGLPFIPDEEVERVISERSAELSKKHGDEVLKFSMSLAMTRSESIIKSLPIPDRAQPAFHQHQSYSCRKGLVKPVAGTERKASPGTQFGLPAQ